MHSTLQLTVLELQIATQALDKIVQQYTPDAPLAGLINETGRELMGRVFVRANKLVWEGRIRCTFRIKPVDIYCLRVMEQAGLLAKLEVMERHILNKLSNPYQYGKKKKQKRP